MRAQFPLLCVPDEPRLAYLDSAATTLRPREVIEAIASAHAHELGSVRRGAYNLARRADDAYEQARAAVAGFIGARSDELVFVRGTTEAINLVAECWARPRLQPGDEVVVTELEHHSNLLPWQRVASQTGAHVVSVPLDAADGFGLSALAARLGPRTRVVACAHVSNVLGFALPIAAIADELRARAPQAVLVVDGAQSVAHMPVDVGALGCDFYAFSGHKLYGPSGIGALFGKREHLASMPPYQLGGGMVGRVATEHTRFIDAPHRFEAGTPNVAGALGLATAVQWLAARDRASIAAHEGALIERAAAGLHTLGGVRMFGREGRVARGEPCALLSFAVDGIHPHDVASVLDTHGVAVRAGHLCAQPLMARLGVPAVLRVSVGLYNDADDIDALVVGLEHARGLLS